MRAEQKRADLKRQRNRAPVGRRRQRHAVRHDEVRPATLAAEGARQEREVQLLARGVLRGLRHLALPLAVQRHVVVVLGLGSNTHVAVPTRRGHVGDELSGPERVVEDVAERRVLPHLVHVGEGPVTVPGVHAGGEQRALSRVAVAEPDLAAAGRRAASGAPAEEEVGLREADRVLGPPFVLEREQARVGAEPVGGLEAFGIGAVRLGLIRREQRREVFDARALFWRDRAQRHCEVARCLFGIIEVVRRDGAPEREQPRGLWRRDRRRFDAVRKPREVRPGALGGVERRQRRVGAKRQRRRRDGGFQVSAGAAGSRLGRAAGVDRAEDVAVDLHVEPADGEKAVCEVLRRVSGLLEDVALVASVYQVDTLLVLEKEELIQFEPSECLVRFGIVWVKSQDLAGHVFHLLTLHEAWSDAALRRAQLRCDERTRATSREAELEDEQRQRVRVAVEPVRDEPLGEATVTRGQRCLGLLRRVARAGGLGVNRSADEERQGERDEAEKTWHQTVEEC